ncbi:hypothetical protein B0T16DRAFT_152736 [Cercophora newfieldiana]|uniref:Uncharacterized protein n=1 Tax=Cercophora newfieldiana TaxID=92897 RepID=A0AA40CR26_9PEZI|nr:hypothetical protein B0T16DRAFT_152736 [Cercophora newfieldiana]
MISHSHSPVSCYEVASTTYTTAGMKGQSGPKRKETTKVGATGAGGLPIVFVCFVSTIPNAIIPRNLNTKHPFWSCLPVPALALLFVGTVLPGRSSLVRQECGYWHEGMWMPRFSALPGRRGAILSSAKKPERGCNGEMVSVNFGNAMPFAGHQLVPWMLLDSCGWLAQHVERSFWGMGQRW